MNPSKHLHYLRKYSDRFILGNISEILTGKVIAASGLRKWDSSQMTGINYFTVSSEKKGNNELYLMIESINKRKLYRHS